MEKMCIRDRYRVVFIGGMVPIPTVSDRVRREVFDRAQNRCQVCGYAAGETYPDGGVVRLQLGHWVPKGQNAEKVDPSNLRADVYKRQLLTVYHFSRWRIVVCAK